MIGKAIYNLLSTNATLIALVPATKIFPYVLNENTDLPAIIYTIDTLEPDYTKDGWVLDDITFSVTSLSNDYDTLQSIVAAVRDALEMISGTIVGTTIIQHIHVSAMIEGYSITEDVFANKLSFNVNVINY